METNEPKFSLRQGLTWSRLALGLQRAQEGLKFLMVLSPISQMWDYRCVPRHTINKNSSWLFTSPALFELFDSGTLTPSTSLQLSQNLDSPQLFPLVSVHLWQILSFLSDPSPISPLELSGS